MAYQLTGPRTLEAGPAHIGRLALALVVLVVVLGAGLGAASAQSGWKSDYWGAVLFGAALALGGGLLIAAQQRLRVDASGVRVWRLARPGAAASGRVALVRMRAEQRTQSSGNSRHSVLVYVAELALEGEGLPEAFALEESRSEGPIRRAAEQVAQHLGVACEDAVGDESELRGSDALDRGFEKRGEQLGSAPAGVRLAWDEVGAGVDLRGLVPRERLPVMLAVAVGAPFSGLVALVLVWAMVDDFALRAFVSVPVLLGDLGLVVWMLAHVKARERVRVAPDRLVRDIWFAGRAWRHQEVSRGTIERLRIQTEHSQNRGLAVVSDERGLVLGRSLDADGLRWLRGWLDAQL